MLSKQERSTILRMSLLFGQGFNTTKEFLESLGIFIVREYAEGREVSIPFVGNLSLTYQGDTIVKGGKQAQVDSEFTPDGFLVRNIGQIQDEETTDAQKIFLDRIKTIFAKYESGTFTLEGDL